MREIPVSTCERSFINQAIKQNQRLDGRKIDEFRSLTINFGAEWGSVLAALGETKVLAQVSCELGLPKATRPNEGMMYINVELGPMAAPHLEAGRNSELNVQINRTLERAFKDSRCVDLESLCVTAEERVWILRVDLNILNHGGNLIDCCSIATLCALAHFKRPDVSVVDDETHVHTAAEKEPIPLVLHHYPVCVTYCTFDDGRIAVADPTDLEERTAESVMIFGLNSFRELCCLNLGGTTLTSTTMLLQCSQRAAAHAKSVVDHIKQLLEDDKQTRQSGQKVGFTEYLRLNTGNDLSEDRLAIKLRYFSFNDIRNKRGKKDTPKQEGDENNGESTSEQDKDSKTAMKWLPDDDDDEEDDGNIEDMDSENSTEVEDDDKNLADHVESTLMLTNQRGNQPISKQRPNFK